MARTYVHTCSISKPANRFLTPSDPLDLAVALAPPVGPASTVNNTMTGARLTVNPVYPVEPVDPVDPLKRRYNAPILLIFSLTISAVSQYECFIKYDINWDI